jgi:hypothetical protein
VATVGGDGSRGDGRANVVGYLLTALAGFAVTYVLWCSAVRMLAGMGGIFYDVACGGLGALPGLVDLTASASIAGAVVAVVLARRVLFSNPPSEPPPPPA